MMFIFVADCPVPAATVAIPPATSSNIPLSRNGPALAVTKIAVGFFLSAPAAIPTRRS